MELVTDGNIQPQPVPITADVATNYLSQYLTSQKEDYATHQNLGAAVMYLSRNAKENEDRNQTENQP